ncbi:MAG: ABC transporter permease [Methylovulum sp.]|uniref:ABC transporter permease n=2 Tax=Methylovulum sp. TaxID=1916980 RepID=UPI002639AD04|nr:ABC transporter permease [Methylovulum sp.]MDD2723471.1 ABC transporter permease [Methylovulum sp.]MDD5123911.1 ABC transporter permease [Methylovulum sp.]
MLSTSKFAGMADIAQAFQCTRIIVFMAFSDVKARYKRSVLGPLWLTLGTAGGSAGLGFIWSELFHVDATTFVPTLTAGLILWQFISGIITESTVLFSRQASIIRNLNLPLAIHPAQLLLRHLINLAHNAPVFFIVALGLGHPITLTAWLALPGLILLALNLLWLALFIGLVGARFRDIEYLTTMVMPLLMLVSPVFYRPNYLPFSEHIIWFNPFSHFIEIVRYPLLGSPPPIFVVETHLVMLVVGWGVTLWLFNRQHHRVAFWV